jgi:hypothetical protein
MITSLYSGPDDGGQAMKEWPWIFVKLLQCSVICLAIGFLDDVAQDDYLRRNTLAALDRLCH